jgi:putative membrane protein
VSKLDKDAAREIEAAFAAAQAKTRAPLGCVVADASADYALGPALAAAALAMFAPWPLLAFTTLSPGRIYLIQLALFAVLIGALAFAPVRAALASRQRRRSAGHRAALVQFARLGLSHAPERNGALLYVSLTERYARIVADVGVEVPQEHWRAIIAEMGAALRRGEAKAALIAAAARMGDLLARDFPAIPGGYVERGKRFHML